MQNARLDETQAEIKIAGRNSNNFGYADDTTLMAEIEELKSLLMKVKESEKVVLRLNIQKTKINIWNRSPVQVWCMRWGAQGWCTGMTLRDGMGREVGGGFRMGNTGTTMLIHVNLWQKPLQYCKVISLQLKKKNPPANAGDRVSIPGSRRFLWRRVWQPSPVFLPGEFHRGAWQAKVHGVAKSQTWLSS